MVEVILNNKTRSLVKPLRVSFCEGYFCRLKGLMFRNSIDPEEGLLLVQRRDSIQNATIHMLFVGMDLGIIWINNDQRVVDKQLAKSWKLYYAPGEPARYVLEIHPDLLSNFEIGDELSFEKDLTG